jgi:hypothetical protein
MYAIEGTPFGFRLTFSGNMDVDEFERWLVDASRILASALARFGVLSDMRFMGTLLPKCQDILIRGQQAFRARGLERSAVVVSKGYVMTQLKIIALTSGICDGERYLDATVRPDWESEALAWIVSGREPAPSVRAGRGMKEER